MCQKQENKGKYIKEIVRNLGRSGEIYDKLPFKSSRLIAWRL